MENTDKMNDPDVRKILEDQELSDEAKIAELKELYTYARAIQRTATESNMAGDDGLNDRLHCIELALKDLGADPNQPEDNMGATL